MKKFSLLSFLTIIAASIFMSCGERYEEETGKVFEGTWTYVESFNDEGIRVPPPSSSARFIQIRANEGADFLLFYTGGRYDSSFFYRTQSENVFVRRVLDSVDVIYSYPQFDNDGNPLLDEGGMQIILRDTIREPQKPLNPESDFSPEKYYGTISFNEGAKLNMIIKRYKVNAAGAPTTDIMIEDIYERPTEKE